MKRLFVEKQVYRHLDERARKKGIPVTDYVVSLVPLTPKVER